MYDFRAQAKMTQKATLSTPQNVTQLMVLPQAPPVEVKVRSKAEVTSELVPFSQAESVRNFACRPVGLAEIHLTVRLSGITELPPTGDREAWVRAREKVFEEQFGPLLDGLTKELELLSLLMTGDYHGT